MSRRGTLLLPLLVVAASCAEQGGGTEVAQLQLVADRAAGEQANADAQPLPVGGAPGEVQAVLNTYCIQCHGEDEQKGRVRFDTLDQLSAEDRADLLERAGEAIAFEEMPPEDETQLTDDDRTTLVAWLTAQTEAAGGDDLADKLRYPHYGNLVDHDLLFSGTIDEPAYTPARRWLVSPQIFHNRVMDVFRLEGRERQNFATRNFYGVTNPFVLPEQSGVRDYDTATLTGGHLLVMLNNAQWIAGKQLFAARLETPERAELQAALSPADRWHPRTTPEPFRAIVLSDTPPTQEQMVAAIQEQFDCVLRREASEQEVGRYLQLLRSSIELGGNTEGLKRMLTAVLLESEFLYRLEFGGGEADEHGRQMLTPREGAYAISYALGDRGPDAELMRAAEEGRLQTREDYEREVRRLLDEENYYRGQVGPEINGRHYQSNEYSHPRTVRFFREFFGYSAATKVFKDLLRSGGFYVNPGRGSFHASGRLISEADLLVTYYVQQDQDVFENMIAGDLYFVAPIDNAQETQAALNRIYDRFKDEDYSTDEAAQLIVDQHGQWLGEQIRQANGARSLRQMLTHTHHFREQGLDPHPQWNYPFGLRMLTRWVNSYSIDPTAWDYPDQQPFVIENRRGILSHPAWLVAHSTNFHTDPIRRGRWIREKLLAGRVPDVPITVDAQVPEGAEHTFRHRLEEVTTPDECWRCHQHMNPLGLPFEIYDDFGRYRTEEDLEHPDNLITQGTPHGQLPVYPTLPIDSSGELNGTGDSALDGEVDSAIELLERLARSDRARQSMIRHAFRFYMGRNEMLSDAQTLIDAERVYIESGGSFESVIISLLTSDSFLYRMDLED